MNGSEPRLPGLTDEEMDQLMDAQLSVAERMTTWQAKPLNVQARKVLRQRNSDILRVYYFTAQFCMGMTLFLWLGSAFLPSTSQVFSISAVRLMLQTTSLVVFIFGLVQTSKFRSAAATIEEI